MPLDTQRAQTIFAAAVAVTDAGARAELVLAECGGDEELRHRVEMLLAAHDDSAGLPAAVRSTFDRTAAFDPVGIEEVGSIIADRYKLLEEIGEGGMGTIWIAEQTKPVRRKVAIKFIKAGLDSKSVLARFEAERQALAVMDHPNIAKVLDGGLTDANRPFFVMEYVKGVPITEYCDAMRLSVPDRLELFVQVCSAVQHAHHKGIIHRDLKPSNILVAPYDDRPVPKVIDFGLAKAMHQSLTEKTLHTAHEVVLGTPLYMSPEQAQLNNLDVDTRADIYALGVLLYELLTGSTPLERRRFKEAAWEEVKRIIREEDPPRPSNRLSSTDMLASLASSRQLAPANLTRLMRGELDWVVMKALEKDRTRRYETANGFAADVNRYLGGEAVLAHPPSTGYRIKKFVRRHRGPVLATGLIGLALAAGIVGTSIGLVHAERARAAEANERQRADDEKQRAIEFRDRALEALRASTGTDVEKLIGAKQHLSANEREYLEAIASRWQAFAQSTGTDAESIASQAEGYFRVGFLWQKLGRREEAHDQYLSARKLQQKLLHDHPDVNEYSFELARTHSNLGLLLSNLGQSDAAQTEFVAARELQQHLADAYPEVLEYQASLAATHNNFGNLLQKMGQGDAARREHESARTLQKRLAANHPGVPDYQEALAATHHNLGSFLSSISQPEAARREYESARELREKLSANYPAMPEYQASLALTHANLGILLTDMRQYEAARTEFDLAQTLNRKLAVDYSNMPRYQSALASTHLNLGNLLSELGQIESARAEYESALRIFKSLADADSAVPKFQEGVASTHANLGALLLNSGQWDAALSEFDAGREVVKRLVADYPAVPRYQLSLARDHNNRGMLLARRGQGQGNVARTEFEAACRVQKKIVAAFPDVPDYKAELAGYHNNLGVLLRNVRQNVAAHSEHESALALQEQLAAEYPMVPQYQINLGGGYCNLGNLVLGEGQPAESLKWYDLAIRTLSPVYAQDRQAVLARQFLGNSRRSRAKAFEQLNEHAKAANDWYESLEVSPPEVQLAIRARLAMAHHNAGQTVEAVAEVAELNNSSTWPADQTYNFACVYAVASGKIDGKEQEYADRAMELLHQAVKAGFQDIARIKKDSDLDSLRADEDFQLLLAQLEDNEEND